MNISPIIVDLTTYSEEDYINLVRKLRPNGLTEDFESSHRASYKLFVKEGYWMVLLAGDGAGILGRVFLPTENTPKPNWFIDFKFINTRFLSTNMDNFDKRLDSVIDSAKNAPDPNQMPQMTPDILEALKNILGPNVKINFQNFNQNDESINSYQDSMNEDENHYQSKNNKKSELDLSRKNIDRILDDLAELNNVFKNLPKKDQLTLNKYSEHLNKINK